MAQLHPLFDLISTAVKDINQDTDNKDDPVEILGNIQRLLGLFEAILALEQNPEVLKTIKEDYKLYSKMANSLSKVNQTSTDDDKDLLTFRADICSTSMDTIVGHTAIKAYFEIVLTTGVVHPIYTPNIGTLTPKSYLLYGYVLKASSCKAFIQS
jgi:hypothetical protein